VHQALELRIADVCTCVDAAVPQAGLCRALVQCGRAQMTTARSADFSQLEVAVVGDLLVDHDLYAEPRRLSREAPVMVLRHVRDRIGAGGAANVARNLRALGCHVHLFGVVGRDDAGGRLLELLEQESITTTGVLAIGGYDTPTKTRVLAAEPRRDAQQILRIDREPVRAVEAKDRATVAAALRAAADSLDAIVLSDYGYGLVGGEIGDAARAIAASGAVAVLDPRGTVRDLAGLTAMTPNLEELASCTGLRAADLDGREALATAAKTLLRLAGCRYLLVTRDSLGMALFGAGLPAAGMFVAASGTERISDVRGAGDTAAAAFALALAAGRPAPDAMALANAAAGVVVLEQGAAVCSVEDLDGALAGAPVTR
jgi:rfaE bifunctional protein kinase chain/domain